MRVRLVWPGSSIYATLVDPSRLFDRLPPALPSDLNELRYERLRQTARREASAIRRIPRARKRHIQLFIRHRHGRIWRSSDRCPRAQAGVSGATSAASVALCDHGRGWQAEWWRAFVSHSRRWRRTIGVESTVQRRRRGNPSGSRRRRKHGACRPLRRGQYGVVTARRGRAGQSADVARRPRGQ